jgi:hypothetical protein
MVLNKLTISFVVLQPLMSRLHDHAQTHHTESDEKNSIWKHTTLTKERHLHPQLDSNPQSQQNGRRPILYIAQTLGSALIKPTEEVTLMTCILDVPLSESNPLHKRAVNSWYCLVCGWFLSTSTCKSKCPCFKLLLKLVQNINLWNKLEILRNLRWTLPSMRFHQVVTKSREET